MVLPDPYRSYVGPTGFPGVDCTPAVFPDPVFLDCPDAYVAHEGEIDEIFLSNVQYNASDLVWEAVVKPSDWTDPATYIVAGIERLIGFGDKPIGEPLTIPLPKGLLKTMDRNHTLNFDITDQHTSNYEFVRTLQGTQYAALWYKTIDNDMFGGADGIIVRVVNAGNVHTRGELALLTGTMIFGWKNLFDPPRTTLAVAEALRAARVKAPEPLKAKKPAEATV